MPPKQNETIRSMRNVRRRGLGARIRFVVAHLFVLLAVVLAPTFSWAQAALLSCSQGEQGSSSDDPTQAVNEETETDADEARALSRIAARQARATRRCSSALTRRAQPLFHVSFAAAVDLRPIKPRAKRESPFLRRRLLRLLN
jgi:hypothetical protein